MFVRITVHCPAPGITSTIAIAIDPRHVYNVIYKGAKNKIVAQKKMIVSFLFVLKFYGGMVAGLVHGSGLGRG